MSTSQGQVISRENITKPKGKAGTPLPGQGKVYFKRRARWDPRTGSKWKSPVTGQDVQPGTDQGAGGRHPRVPWPHSLPSSRLQQRWK